MFRRDEETKNKRTNKSKAHVDRSMLFIFTFVGAVDGDLKTLASVMKPESIVTS